MAKFAQRHWAICALSLLAIVIRALVMTAYAPAFWFYADSGSFISRSLAPGLDPYEANGLGYTVVLKILRFTGSFAVVVGLQHLVGVLLGIAVYALLCRRGLPRWLACIAALPVFFDGMQITLEHYVLGEAVFTALAVLGVLLLLWHRVPSVLACAASGFVIMMSWFARPSTLPIAILLAIYLVARRVGWRRVVAFTAAFLIPYAAVVVWIGDRPSAYGTSYANRAYYSRVASFVDCDRIELTDAERKLCPSEPLGLRHDRPDWYGWNGPALQVPREHNDILRTFALKAIAGQPGDYASTVLRDLAPHFVPGARLGPEQECLRARWTMPQTMRDLPVESSCAPGLARRGWESAHADPAQAPAATGLTVALSRYSHTIRFQPWLVSLALLLVLVAVVTTYRPGRRLSDVRDGVLLAGITLALLVPPVLVAMFEARYGLPALPFAGAMGALAMHHLMRLRRNGNALETSGADAGENLVSTVR